MTKTLLEGVNDLLKRLSLIQGDSGELTTLTSGAFQNAIDVSVQIFNEIVVDAYTMCEMPLPSQLKESDITLATGDRDYSLPADFVEIYWPLHNTTDGYYISEYTGGWLDLVNSQPQPANFTGRPTLAAISPVDNTIYMDRIPTANENGEVYKLRYSRKFTLAEAADTFPFNDAIYEAMIPAAKELYARDKEKDFKSDLFDFHFSRMLRLLNPNQPQRSYGTLRQVIVNPTDPYDSSDARR